MIHVKICGVTTAEDAAAVAEAGADALGLNFYDRSPRFVSEARAAEIVLALPAHVLPVGVFVTQSLPEMVAIAERVGLRALQTYTDAPPKADPRFKSLPAFRVRSIEDLNRIRDFVLQIQQSRSATFPEVAVLVDSFVAGEMGGTGRTAPWELLAAFDPGVPLILAGGLTPENVADAIRIVRPWGVDVAGGVESSPGKKDHGRIRAFVAAVRSAAREFAVPPVSG